MSRLKYFDNDINKVMLNQMIIGNEILKFIDKRINENKSKQT